MELQAAKLPHNNMNLSESPIHQSQDTLAQQNWFDVCRDSYPSNPDLPAAANYFNVCRVTFMLTFAHRIINFKR